MSKDFRFGLSLRSTASRAAVQEAAVRGEALGYDVLLVPDHLGAPAPFPVLATAGAATETMRLGTFVFNACFYKPALRSRRRSSASPVDDRRRRTLTRSLNESRSYATQPATASTNSS